MFKITKNIRSLSLMIKRQATQTVLSYWECNSSLSTSIKIMELLMKDSFNYGQTKCLLVLNQYLNLMWIHQVKINMLHLKQKQVNQFNIILISMAMNIFGLMFNKEIRKTSGQLMLNKTVTYQKDLLAYQRVILKIKQLSALQKLIGLTFSVLLRAVLNLLIYLSDTYILTQILISMIGLSKVSVSGSNPT
ncbi:transmembrane protein, putative (macronuclear) [Tetrahymena thermophila SB210]|uniref:Transmembrane protein, putative n=1 Tax=Tetrahymena thermophila (strain SB210) TaxID=312017 RepID=W7X6F4_TETTS|nr:transmembrane protein, putative [Tetrahymena thermophila SB210]EWS72992.1 transmembrane protein, putative [Tetrahymena thermophila SB210]|eukprot:XP_012654476.1 transmembrane protein, putative [Tetrahymena thermophila SB210]